MGPQLTPAEWDALSLSLKVALWAMLGGLPVAFALAYALARCRFWGKGLLNGLVHLPLVLPPVVTGYLLLLAFGRTGPIGQLLESLFGITLAFRWTGAALAAGIMGLPFMVRSIRLSLEAIDPRLEIAARTLGARRWRVFFTITLPLALPGVCAGAILGFAKALGEFGATITFASNIPGETQTLALAIFAFLQVPGAENQVLRLSILAIVLSMVALFAAEALSERFHQRRRSHVD
ncbi:molybdate ABC transporter permease subunit [Pedomonas mirosovicensis]|uniref:molybdate ABC transporter permease subunit n=1 Tax=Pedomonas mirosovicensis TaxID=2908641 RepID=UPI0021688290|nr:molybdate ABC transporter permease subunit [Pedomonas mirosovicensis]MCH8684828.1 molybdate ABC transporter permease subunit [Pedomonas mirosovicensis]